MLPHTPFSTRGVMHTGPGSHAPLSVSQTLDQMPRCRTKPCRRLDHAWRMILRSTASYLAARRHCRAGLCLTENGLSSTRPSKACALSSGHPHDAPSSIYRFFCFRNTYAHVLMLCCKHHSVPLRHHVQAQPGAPWCGDQHCCIEGLQPPRVGQAGRAHCNPHVSPPLRKSDVMRSCGICG
jgi:hypothetical protein